MTDVTQDRDQAGTELSAADEQVLRELTERARTGGLKLTGEGGLLGKLTKMVIEGALEGELDDHLGYGKHEPEGRDGGNSRNGRRAKTVLTDTGPVEISVPRDRDSSFEPGIVAKRQRRLTGVDDMVISLSAKGPLPLSSWTCVCFRQVRRDDRDVVRGFLSWPFPAFSGRSS